MTWHEHYITLITISYKEIAACIGNDKAYRAVGGACGRNKINILIPCHRVLGANYALSGYNAGINKKESLLKHEQIRI